MMKNNFFAQCAANLWCCHRGSRRVAAPARAVRRDIEGLRGNTLLAKIGEVVRQIAPGARDHERDGTVRGGDAVGENISAIAHDPLVDAGGAGALESGKRKSHEGVVPQTDAGRLVARGAIATVQGVNSTVARSGNEKLAS
jgi:hypothetical protein